MPRKLHVGQRFGHLSIIGPGRERTFEVICDCGSKFEVYPSELTKDKGRTSCGCASGWRKPNDLVGEFIGGAKVLSLDRVLPSGNRVWLCLCPCSKTFTATVTVLNKGKSLCRGCSFSRQREDVLKQFEPGMRFGLLTVLGPHPNSLRSPAGGGLRDPKILCKCDCGNRFAADAKSMRSGNTTSCGCAKTSKLQRPASKIWNIAGKELTTQEVCDLFGINPVTFLARVNRYGMPPEEAASMSVHDARSRATKAGWTRRKRR